MYRLIYKSRASEPISKKMFRDILYSSVSNNQEQSINGALLATHTHFLQFLEGSFSAVNETFFKIVHDTRHTKIQIISFIPVEQAIFDSWRMRGFGIFNLNTELDKKLKDVYGSEEGGIALPIDEQAALSLVREVELMKEIIRVNE